MGLNKYDKNKILHDIRRMSDAIQIIIDEENPKKRKIIADLLRAEMDRLHQDIEEMSNDN